MKLKRIAAIIGLGLLGTTVTAQAYDVQLWQFQDDSIDFVLRVDEQGNLGIPPVTSGLPQIGDILVSVFEMPSASATPPGVSLIPPGKELTGVAVIQLAGTYDPFNINLPNDPTLNPYWVFQPYAGGMNSVLSLIGAGAPSVVGGNPGGGAMAAMWLNNSPPGYPGKDPGLTDRNLVLDAADPVYGQTTNCTSLADCLKEASIGTLFQVDGMWGVDVNDRFDPDNFWKSEASTAFTPPITYDQVKSGAADTRFAMMSAGLSNLYNIAEPVLFKDINNGTHCVGATHGDDDDCVQVRMTGDILGGAGLVNGAIARDDIDASKLVPEPTTLGLLGLGLLGLGLMRRRQG